MSDKELLNVKQVSEVLGCSPRTVFRLADSGKIPFGVKVSALRRWPKAEIENWITNGCPNCRKAVVK